MYAIVKSTEFEIPSPGSLRLYLGELLIHPTAGSIVVGLRINGAPPFRLYRVGISLLKARRIGGRHTVAIVWQSSIKQNDLLWFQYLRVQLL